MSGGHFDYAQYRLEEIAESIDDLIRTNDSTEKDEYGDEEGRHYSDDIIEKFKEASDALRRAQAMAHRIDWLVCSDDGEDSFRERWKRDLNPKMIESHRRWKQ